MKIAVRNILALRPFDESAERDRAQEHLTRLWLLSVSLGLALLLSVTACFMAALQTGLAVPVLCAAVGTNLLTVGIEWHLGLRARAGNRLTATLLMTAGIAAIFFGL